MIAKENIEIVEMLISAGAKVDLIVDGYTPLSYAIRYSHVEVVKLLVSAGADVNAKIVGIGSTVLSYASFIGNPAVIECLSGEKDMMRKTR